MLYSYLMLRKPISVVYRLLRVHEFKNYCKMTQWRIYRVIIFTYVFNRFVIKPVSSYLQNNARKRSPAFKRDISKNNIYVKNESSSHLPPAHHFNWANDNTTVSKR